MKRTDVPSLVVILFILAVAVIFVGGLSLAVRHRGARAGVPRLPEPPPLAQRVTLDAERLVDLTHDFAEDTIYWPTEAGFQWKRQAWGQTEGGYFYAGASFAASEHGGTHLDSPIHFAEGKWTTEEIPLQRLVAPAVVLDVAPAAARDRNYLLRPEDVRRFEERYGAIPEGAIVLVHTGWGRFWPDRRRYMGTDKAGDVAGLSFPGISSQAAELLAQRRVAGVGIDTPSLDHGPSTDFMAHRILYERNIYGLENVANMEKLPPTGATVIALPMKIRGGTGGPARIVALLP
jgi:kynurenine formamidase